MRIASIFLLLPHLSLSVIAAPSRTHPSAGARMTNAHCAECTEDDLSPPPVIPTYCSPSELSPEPFTSFNHHSIVHSVMRSARGLIDTAYLSLPDTWDDRMQKWFGEWSQGREDIVRHNFRQLYEFHFTRLVIHVQDRCEPNEIGLTGPANFPNVLLCPDFFKLSNFQEQAGALIHEVTHFNCIANTIYVPEQYGDYCAEKLARDCPNKATKNADNYRQYVLELPVTFGCSKARIKAIIQAHAKAIGIAVDAISFLAMDEDKWAPLLKTWFGEYTSAQDVTIRGNVKKMQKIINQLEYTCANECAGSGTFGLVQANEFPSVQLCPKFFNVPETHDRAGDILNLLSQFENVAGANLSPERRGPQACKALAEDDPESAIHNPDNYRFFMKAAAKAKEGPEEPKDSEDREGTPDIGAIQYLAVLFNRVLADLGAAIY